MRTYQVRRGRGLPSGADHIPNQSRVAARIDHRGDDRTIRFDKGVNGQMTAGDKGAAVVVELERKHLGVSFDAIGRGEITVQKLFAASRAARRK